MNVVIPPLSRKATRVQAVPSQYLDQGFRLLTLREFRNENAPSAFAWIEQRLLRMPQRLGRHGLFFANTFRPEIMAWLTQELGRPSIRTETSQTCRNTLWPTLQWFSKECAWPDGARTVEWFVDIVFPHKASWTAFERRWRRELMGADDDRRVPVPAGGEPNASESIASARRDQGRLTGRPDSESRRSGCAGDGKTLARRPASGNGRTHIQEDD